MNEDFIKEYWQVVADQDRDKLRSFFDPRAIINWHDSKESFTVEEFIIANCDYPGSWSGEVKRIEYLSDKIITVTEVSSVDVVVHAVSFLKFYENKNRYQKNTELFYENSV